MDPLVVSCFFSVFAFFVTGYAIDTLSPHFISKGLLGKDLLKASQPQVAESMG
jgi:hypothetical protein